MDSAELLLSWPRTSPLLVLPTLSFSTSSNPPGVLATRNRRTLFVSSRFRIFIVDVGYPRENQRADFTRDYHHGSCSHLSGHRLRNRGFTQISRFTARRYLLREDSVGSSGNWSRVFFHLDDFVFRFCISPYLFLFV